MENPYHWITAQTSLFYGENRVQLVREIIDRLKTGESLAILGGRRLGKTTLLRRSEQELRGRRTGLLPVYIDAQTMPGASTPQEAFQWIRRQVSLQVGTDLAANSEGLGHWVVKAVDHANCLKLVLLIDEFDLFREYSWSSTFFNNWRALIHNLPGVSERLVVVVTGGRRLQALYESPGSPLANVFTWKYLSPLDRSDTVKMVNEPTKGRFGEELAERIWLETGGHPFLIQFLMHHLCLLAQKTDVTTAFELAKDRFLDEHDIVFKQWWFDHLTNDERQVYRLLRMRRTATLAEIATELGLSLNAVRERVRTLSWVGIVRWAGVSCEPAGRLFAEWVKGFDIESDIVTENSSLRLAYYGLHELFDEMERMVRDFVVTQLKRRHGLTILVKLFPDHVRKANINYQRATQGTGECPLEELLTYGDFSWPFEIILRLWNEFYQGFCSDTRVQILGRDVKKAKQRFEERKEVLTRIRNAIRHARPISEEDRDKARVFCRDLLALTGTVVEDSDAG